MSDILNRKVLAIALVMLAVWVGHGLWGLYLQRAAVSLQVGDLESKAAVLQENNQFLASASAYFSSDAYLEKQARLKLNYKLSDEQVAFVYPAASASAAPTSAAAGSSALADWKQWLKNILHLK